MDEFSTVRRESWAYQNLLGQDKRNQCTLSVTFATPGNVVVGYTDRHASWRRKGNDISLDWSIVVTTFTHSSASGALRLSGMPFAVENRSGHFPVGSVSWQGINKANYTQIVPYGSPGQTYITFRTSGMAQSAADVLVADVSTGSLITLYGHLDYEV